MKCNVDAAQDEAGFTKPFNRNKIGDLRSSLDHQWYEQRLSMVKAKTVPKAPRRHEKYVERRQEKVKDH